MHLSEDLRKLAVRMRCGDPDNPRALRETLEAGLLPLIRCAIRSGTGLPALVSWVRSNLAAEPGGRADPARAAPFMARRLCAALLGPDAGADARPDARRETVVGL
jgi:hypothetical protein